MIKAKVYYLIPKLFLNICLCKIPRPGQSIRNKQFFLFERNFWVDNFELGQKGRRILKPHDPMLSHVYSHVCILHGEYILPPDMMAG